MSKKRKTLLFFICYLAYTSIYIARLNLSISSPVLTSASILDKAQVGIIGGVFSVVYAVGRIVNGYISDKKSPCFMIAGGLVTVSLSNILIGLIPGFYSMLALWSCNAYAQSMLWSSILCIIASVYDQETAKKKSSVLVSSVAVGNILGILINTAIVNAFGFRYAFIIPGMLTLIFSFLIVVSTGKIRAIKNDSSQKHISFFALFLNKKIQNILIPAMCHGVMKDNISLWMMAFFVEQYQINLSESALFALFIPAVGFIGRLLYPFCYRLCRWDEKRLTAYCFVVCAAASVPLCFPALPVLAAMLCLSAIYASVSVANTSFVSIFPLGFIESGNVASISGVMDFVTYLGAGIGSFAYGILIKSFGYLPMFSSWTILSLLSVALLFRANRVCAE